MTSMIEKAARALAAPLTPPLGTLRIQWSEIFGLRVWHEKGGKPLRAWELAAFMLALVAFVVFEP